MRWIDRIFKLWEFGLLVWATYVEKKSLTGMIASNPAVRDEAPNRHNTEITNKGVSGGYRSARDWIEVNFPF
jgi:hypothetical protein